MFTVPATAIRFAGTRAVSCDELPKVVVSAVLPQFTTAPFTKFVPVTARTKPWPPAVVEVGEMMPTPGTPALMANDTRDDAPPLVVVTVILAVPAVAMSLAGTAACTCVELTTIVDSAEPFQLTTAVESKFAPVTVKVNPAPPAVAEAGEKPLLLIVGALAALIVNAAPVDVTADSDTVILAVPAVAIRLAGTAAVSCPEFTKLVVSAVLPQFT